MYVDMTIPSKGKIEPMNLGEWVLIGLLTETEKYLKSIQSVRSPRSDLLSGNVS